MLIGTVQVCFLNQLFVFQTGRQK